MQTLTDERIEAAIIKHNAKLFIRESTSKIDKASEFLTELLSESDVPAAKAIAQADEQGISKRTLERARASLGVKARQEGGRWVWSLDEGG